MQSEPYIQPMQSPEPYPIICIVGPTGAGKTHLAMSLAEYAKSIGLKIELISMDSALVYRGLDIGSAKPTKEEQKLVAHHLIDILEPSEVYSAARFAKDAKRLSEEIRNRGNIPVVVGGTMLYWRAWAYGLSSLPPAYPEIRVRLEDQAKEIGCAKRRRFLTMIRGSGSLSAAKQSEKASGRRRLGAFFFCARN
jgi:tRNA dimethylallyltransferase